MGQPQEKRTFIKNEESASITSCPEKKKGGLSLLQARDPGRTPSRQKGKKGKEMASVWRAARGGGGVRERRKMMRSGEESRRGEEKGERGNSPLSPINRREEEGGLCISQPPTKGGKEGRPSS